MSRARLARSLACGVVLVMLSLAAPVNAAPAPALRIEGGVSAPQFSYADAIRETVWVDTGLDLDADGQRDRVAADIIRPSETDRRGQQVPVIMDASPYYSCCGRGNESEKKTYGKDGRPKGFPLFYDNYFVPRGYATVLVDLAGTNRSRGCVDVGGQSDIQSAKAVVDWLNGNAEGFTTTSGGQRVDADWTTGAVGMIGKSYDGTIANGVAATGVEGLRTIVPIAAISSWYDYYRSDGVRFTSGTPTGLARTVDEDKRPECAPVKRRLTSGAPDNGDVTPLWTDRDYLPDMSKVRASVFASHGWGDLNVKTIHFGQLWDELERNNVPRKVWLTQAGHVDPFDYRRADWVYTLHRWFDRWLLDVRNGIDREPMASIERAPDTWVDERSWPPRRTVTAGLQPRTGDKPGVGKLGLEPAAAGSTASFTDNPDLTQYDWAKKPNTGSPARTIFNTGPLRKELRISGTSEVTVRATPSSPTAHLTATLVDYGPSRIRDYLSPGEGVRTVEREDCWGQNRPGDNACYKKTPTTVANVDSEIFARGWADLANHRSLSQQRPLTPGKAYDMTFRLSTTDHIVPAGHQLALIIGGTDAEFIPAPKNPPKVRLDLRGTSIRVPVVGGPGALRPGNATPLVTERAYSLSRDEPSSGLPR